MGTSPDAIDLAEDRDRFAALLDSLDIAYPRSAMASGLEEARSAAREIGYPLLVRPSYVLGGGAWASSTTTRGSRATWPRRPPFPRTPRVSGQVPGRRRGMRPGRPVRRRGRVHRRHPGAHRDGRHPLGRLGLLPAALLAVREGAGRDGERRPQDRPGPGRARSGEHPVRREGRGRLRHRGQPAGEPHGALHLEGDGACPWQSSPAASWRGRSWPR